MIPNITDNSNTNPQELQIDTGQQDPTQAPQGQGQMNPDDIAATLGMLTTISHQHQLATNPQPPEQAPTAPTDQKPQEDLTPKLDALQKEVDDLKKEVKKKDSSVEDMKKMIEDALAGDTKDEPVKT